MNLPWWAWTLIGVMVGVGVLYAGGRLIIVKAFEKWW